jgi:sec-independent protein translocase protein TatC
MLRTALRARALGHEDRLTVVGHLDELRRRLLVSLLALAISFGICFWQNHRLLHWLDAPLAAQTQTQVRGGHGPLGAIHTVAVSARDLGVQLRRVVGVLNTRRAAPTIVATLASARAGVDRAISRLTTLPSGNQPVTLGIGEPFTTTVTVSLLFALILTLPVLLGQAYGFLIPAFGPHQRRSARLVFAAVPGLFLAGAMFGYYVVLPAAVHFFQNFNSDQFNVLVQASQYYKFAATTMLAMGAVFEVPVVILAVTNTGVVTARRLRHSRRYAVAGCALVAALLPGDVTTMLLETVPLYLLFEIGVALAAVSERRARRRAFAAGDTAVAP